MTTLHSWTDMAEEAESGIGRRRIVGAGADLVLLTVPAGTEAARHSHPFEQFVQVISGGGELDTENGRRRFGAGHVFHFAPQTWHAARFDEDTVLVEVNIKAG